MKMGSLQMRFRAVFGLHNIYDGTTCYISKHHRDVHDYPERKGGDGTPSHFYTYTCPACGAKFGI